jgi:uncharacterized LabA/DUF88 family protein
MNIHLDTYAIFIDGDNINHLYYKEIYNIFKQRGNIILQKIYGDFTEDNIKPWKKNCLDYGIEPIIAWNLGNKNSSDIKMTTDMMSILTEYPHINNYVVASGDSDFREVCSKIVSKGKNVIGISVNAKSTSHILKNYCSEYIILDLCIKLEKKNKEETYDNNDINLNKINEQAIISIQKILKKYNGELNIGELKRRLCNKNPLFNEQNLGYSNFSQYILSLESIIKITKDQFGNYYAHL